MARRRRDRRAGGQRGPGRRRDRPSTSSAVGGGGGIAEQEDSAWLGGGGMAEQEDSAVLGGGGIAGAGGSAVLGGGGITEPERAFPNSILLIVRLRGLVGKSSIRPGVSSAGSDVSPGGAGIVRAREPTTRGEGMFGWTGEHVRHAAEMVRQGRESCRARLREHWIGILPGAVAGLARTWGCGTGPVRRIRPRPHAVGWWRRWRPRFRPGASSWTPANGLGVQDELIAELARPRQLVAVNITEWQLAAGRRRLAELAPRRWWVTRRGCPSPVGLPTGSSAWRRRSISAPGGPSSSSVTGVGPAAS